MSPKTKPCDKAHAAARLKIAEQFLEFAETGEIIIASNPYRPNAQISNYVQAGIAAADAICCVELKEHSWGDNHSDATALIRKVKPDGAALSKDLGVLLGLKTASSYGASPMKAKDVTRAKRASEHLVTSARDRVNS